MEVACCLFSLFLQTVLLLLFGFALPPLSLAWQMLCPSLTYTRFNGPAHPASLSESKRLQRKSLRSRRSLNGRVLYDAWAWAWARRAALDLARERCIELIVVQPCPRLPYILLRIRTHGIPVDRSSFS
ncbi:hypothetical protein EDB82DRAFT_207508 [Fusarium venenatum]|uniref:uncharacterized protein n=1 Tax=Fusarium venenatum TaxID=56646 RepID=UPI001E138531|nr:hypothetical protein EDB82DRAFT_207508 [Fusarium venenatum]